MLLFYNSLTIIISSEGKKFAIVKSMDKFSKGVGICKSITSQLEFNDFHPNCIIVIVIVESNILFALSLSLSLMSLLFGAVTTD